MPPRPTPSAPTPPANTDPPGALKVFNDFKDLRVVGMAESKRSDTLGYRTFHKISKAVLLFFVKEAVNDRGDVLRNVRISNNEMCDAHFLEPCF